MTIMGASLAEVAALLSMLSILLAGAGRFYHKFRTTISAPLIDSMDKLRQEISQLDEHIRHDYDELKSKTDDLEERLCLQENRLKRKEMKQSETSRLVNHA